MKYIENELDESEYTIDLFALINNLWVGTKKFGWIILILALITSSAACLKVKRSFYPYYTASATFTVNLDLDSSTSIYEDSLRASQMSTTFPYILTSSLLRNIIAADLGVDYVYEDISAENIEDTNLFTISVSSDDPEWAYNVLQSVIKNYPKVAETVVGSTHLNMIEETGVPKIPDNSLNYKSSIKTGAIPGAALGIIIILAYALTRRTVYKMDDLTGLTNMKQIGVLPKVTFKKRGRNKQNEISLRNSKLSSGYLENIYKIRTRLEKLVKTKGIKSILITSSIPSEGKSTIALNLALALAEEGKKVILVDFDLRHPSIKTMLSLHEEAAGFEDVLNDEAELKEKIKYIEELKISVLACSQPVKNSSEIIGTPKIGGYITELEEEYDFVILDTAPSAILSDTSDLAKYVGGALFVIKQDYAKVNHILEALDHLSDSSSIEILGCVFNHIRTGIGGYGYGYGYGYGKYGSYGYGRRKHRDELAVDEQ